MKKYLILFFVILISLLLTAPWYQTDGAREDLFEHSNYTFKARQTSCNCDGSCIYRDSHWVPFGVVIKDCSYDYYYKIFWGKEFYVESKVSTQI